MTFLRNKKIALVITVAVTLVIIAGLVVGCYFGSQQIKRNNRIKNLEVIEFNTTAKNVILMIGDGMGVNHLEITKKYYDLEILNMEKLAAFKGKVNTFSKDNWTTDSAAAATALSTGYKVNNGEIAYHKGENIETISELAMSLGKKVGVIATEGLHGATPGSFSGHAKHRNDVEDIISTQIVSGISLFIGADKQTYDKHKNDIVNEGYTYINEYDDLVNIKNANVQMEDKIFATFEKFETEEGKNETPTLEEVSSFAVDYLERISGDEGFFLMIEGSHIDKRSHSNDLFGMIHQLKGFDDAIKCVAEWTNANAETMLMVTADHETGNLQYNGESKSELSDKLFKSGGHTSQDVYIFYYGITPSKAIFEDKIIDNTHIAKIMMQTCSNYSRSTINLAA